jgi:hypothetical protein
MLFASRQTLSIEAAFIAVLIAAPIVSGQGKHGRTDVTDLKFTDAAKHREIGLTMKESFGSSRLGCDSDNYSNEINWGGGNPSGSHGVSRDSRRPFLRDGRPAIAAGVVEMYDDTHSYPAVATYTATLQTNAKCYGGWPLDTYQATTTVTVHARRPVREVRFTNVPVKAGNAAVLRIILTEKAPPSGTRVFLSVVPPSAKAAFTNLPEYVVVSPDRNDQEFEIITASPRVVPSVAIRARTIGTLRVTPNLQIDP